LDTFLKIFPVYAALVGAWEIGNGILHDVFVVAQHKGEYDRDLLRLLMDGHILITCGIMHVIAWYLIQNSNKAGVWLCMAACVSMLVYLGMIWPFLKSLITIFLNASLLLLSLVCILQ
jgi:hypothetical protein